MRKLTLVLLLWSAWILPAYAFNLGFLAYSPAYYFAKSDWALMEKAVNQALDSPSGTKTEWRNPETTAYGYVIPINSFTSESMPCRQVRIFNSARQVTDMVTYRFCKVNKEWKVV